MRQFDAEKTKRYLINFLADEIKTRGFNKGVVGVSGGLDSAVVANLLSQSIGNENTVCVIMPVDSTQEEDINDAKEIIKNLNTKKYRIDISPMINGYFSYFPDADKIRRGNKMARERMSILYDISCLEDALVIGTGNKTEYTLGYFTIHGDGSYAINPIGDLYKCEVRLLAYHIGIPDKIIQKTPTAGLWNGQTDEQDLGYSYDIIDELLYYILDFQYKKEKLLEMDFNRIFVESILQRVNNSEFKRRPPYIIKIPQEVKYDNIPEGNSQRG